MRYIKENEPDREADHQRRTEHRLQEWRLERLEDDPRAVHTEEDEDPNLGQEHRVLHKVEQGTQWGPE